MRNFHHDINIREGNISNFHTPFNPIFRLTPAAHLLFFADEQHLADILFLWHFTADMYIKAKHILWYGTLNCNRLSFWTKICGVESGLGPALHTAAEPVSTFFQILTLSIAISCCGTFRKTLTNFFGDLKTEEHHSQWSNKRSSLWYEGGT